MDDLDILRTHIIANDLMLVSGFQPKASVPEEEEWRPLFFSKTFVKENKGITLEQFALEEKELKEIGIKVTKLRKDILIAADKEASI